MLRPVQGQSHNFTNTEVKNPNPEPPTPAEYFDLKLNIFVNCDIFSINLGFCTVIMRLKFSVQFIIHLIAPMSLSPFHSANKKISGGQTLSSVMYCMYVCMCFFISFSSNSQIVSIKNKGISQQ